MKAGVMNVISGSPHEMEILVPPGKYELISERKDVFFFWSESHRERSESSSYKKAANRVLRLKRLGSE